MERAEYFGTFEDLCEMLEYIKAYPERFIEYLQEGVISDIPVVLDVLVDYHDWWDEEFKKWRNNE